MLNNRNNTNISNKANYQILASFARSFDKSHIESGRIHLLSSIYLSKGNDSLNIISVLKSYVQGHHSGIFNSKLYIFILVNEDVYKYGERYKELASGFYNNIVIVYTTLERLIYHIGLLSKEKDDLFSSIFGDQDIESKDFDSIASQSLFIFDNQLWSNIVLKFKLHNIDISGGSIPKRHVLHTVDYQLAINLFKLFGDSIDLNKNLYFSSKDPILSSSISLDWLDESILNKSAIQKLTIEGCENLLKDDRINNQEEYSESLEIILNNYLISAQCLFLDIVNRMESECTSIEKKISNLNSKIESLDSEISKLTYIEDESTINLRNTEKKRLKKEKSFIINNNLNNIGRLNKLKNDLEEKRLELEGLKIELSKNKLKLEKLQNKRLEYTLLELNNLYSKNNYKQPTKKYIRDKKVNIEKREYTTMATARDRTSKGFSLGSSLNQETELEINCKAGSPIRSTSSPLSYYYGIRIFHSSTNRQILNKRKAEEIKADPLGEYLTSIKDIINNSIFNPREAQSRIENIWINLIESKLADQDYLINTHASKLHSVLFEAQKTLNNPRLVRTLNKKFPVLGKNLSRIEFLLLAFTTVITYSNRLSYTAIARIIGDNILYIIYKKSGTQLNYREFVENADKEGQLTILLGDFYLSILTQYPHDLFVRVFSKSSYYLRESVTISINSYYIEEIRNNVVVNPYSLPMLCQPNQWNENSFGGYLENTKKKVGIITGNSHHEHKMKPMSSLYKTVNYLNSKRFSINKTLLEYLKTEGQYLLDIIKPENILQREITLKIADLFSNVPFYLNVQADWRGRIYTQSFFISYQGGDLSSALLNFWEGKPLTESGKYYLYIHGANNHNENGISKQSFENRYNWVASNYNKIINLDQSLIVSAEKPFAFLAFCLNLKALDENPNAIISTPVFLDATCSGIQHLSALLLDLELGVSVNLSPYNQDNKPNDIYSDLLLHINNAINKFGEENPDFEHFQLIKLTRSEIKTSVMTKVYNVSQYGMAKQLESKFKIEEALEKITDSLSNSLKENKRNSIKNNVVYRAMTIDNRPITLKKYDIFKIASIINDQIFVVYPSLNNIYNYFIEITKIMIKLGIPISWMTPNGVEITQNYLKSRQSIISTKLFQKTKKIVIKEYLNETDSSKQTNAIIPNIIHSLDASHLINVINSTPYSEYIITVHDCFGTHPNDMEILATRVKKEFILLYTQDNFLQKFHDRIIQSIKDNNFEINLNQMEHGYFVIFNDEYIKIPNVPKLGSLDLQKIVDSKYMIT